MTTGYRFHLTCPVDGAPVAHQAAGVTNGTATVAVARCTECDRQLLLEVTLTVAGRERRYDHNARTRAWKQANPEKVAAQRQRYYDKRRAGVVA